jgi:hypothetical protein
MMTKKRQTGFPPLERPAALGLPPIGAPAAVIDVAQIMAALVAERGALNSLIEALERTPRKPGPGLAAPGRSDRQLHLAVKNSHDQNDKLFN